MSIFDAYWLECVAQIVKSGFDIIDSWRVRSAPLPQCISVKANSFCKIYLAASLLVHFFKQKLHNRVAIGNGWSISKLPHLLCRTPLPT